jgi:hypothetical protein
MATGNSTGGIWDSLNYQFHEPTIIWILISLGLGGLLTEVIKFVFEQTIPEWQRKKATRSAIQKYSYPLEITLGIND